MYVYGVLLSVFSQTISHSQNHSKQLLIRKNRSRFLLLFATSVAMGSSNYAAISQEMSHAEESEDPSTRPRRRIWPKEWSSFLSIMTILLAVSIMLNAVLLSRFYLRPWELMSNLPTRYGI